MQLPSVDRPPGTRLFGVDGPASNGNRVIPVAPVNPPVLASPAAAAAPASVVNKIGEAAATQSPIYNAVHQSVPDPIRRGTETAAEPRDWTLKRPEPEQVEEPSPVPLHQVLINFIKSMWQASGMAVELSQAQKQNQPVNPSNPAMLPGEIAREELTYQPSKIKKTENI